MSLTSGIENQPKSRGPTMRILIATDAWHPQVNGVVRTLTSLARSAATLDADISFLTPEGFPSVGVPTYPGLRMALPNRREIARRIEQAAPEAIHIATEGPIGWAVRGYCRRNKLAFTTSYTTRFPEYVEVRTMIPASVGYALLRHFIRPHRRSWSQPPRCGRNWPSAVFAGSAPGAAASIRNFSIRTTLQRSTCRGRSS